MDRHLRKPLGVNTPAAGNTAARQFAIAYAQYRAGEAGLPGELTAAAKREEKEPGEGARRAKNLSAG